MEGNVCPDVGVPFGMTQWTPQTISPKQKGIPPYRYYDPMIQGFQGSHWLSGGATQDYGSVTVMPITGSLKVEPQFRASKFTHKDEVATPYYYKVYINDYHITAEMTGTSHAGFLQFHFPKNDSSYVIIDSNAGYQPTKKNKNGLGYIKILPDKREIIGYDPVYRMYQGWGKSAGFSGYFIIRFNKAFSDFGTWNAGEKPKMRSQSANNQPGAFVRFQTSKNEVIKAEIGMSFTSIKEARKNLEAEISTWDFDRIKNQTRKKWNQILSKVKVKGGNSDQKTMFYTALYHAMQLPRQISNVDGTYNKFDSQHKVIQDENHVEYGDYSLWDTFRAEQPLLTLMEPGKVGDMLQSLVDKGEQGGFLPIFPAWDNYTSEMIGDHALPVITDAYEKGIRGFNVNEAYKLMKKNATQLPESYKAYLSGKGRRALKTYMKYGYIPLQDSVKNAFHQQEQVSRTLEYAYDDWTLSQLAKSLHKKKDYHRFLKRSAYYKNVFDSTTGFARGRNANGSWAKDFKPTFHYHYFTEGTSWQYSWFVPQNIPELIHLMGGRKKFVSKLDTFFVDAGNFSPAFRSNPYYWQGNEPDQAAPYLFACAGNPWKTQYWVRTIMKRSYQDNAGGLPGNDDAGQMSAWYAFSAMGLYPVCPGSPYYVLSSPVFSAITINLKDGHTFTIIAKDNSNENIYIESAFLNGNKLNTPFISHKDIIKGGKLVLQMGSHPNKKWGRNYNKFPSLFR